MGALAQFTSYHHWQENFSWLKMVPFGHRMELWAPSWQRCTTWQAVSVSAKKPLSFMREHENEVWGTSARTGYSWPALPGMPSLSESAGNEASPMLAPRWVVVPVELELLLLLLLLVPIRLVSVVRVAEATLADGKMGAGNERRPWCCCWGAATALGFLTGRRGTSSSKMVVLEKGSPVVGLAWACGTLGGVTPSSRKFNSGDRLLLVKDRPELGSSESSKSLEELEDEDAGGGA